MPNQVYPGYILAIKSYLNNIPQCMTSILLVENFGGHAALLVANRRKHVAGLTYYFFGGRLLLQEFKG